MTALVWLLLLASVQRGVLGRNDLLKIFYSRRTWGRPRGEEIRWMHGIR